MRTVILATFLFLTATAWSQEKSLTIHQDRPSLLTSHHKPGDIEVYRTVLPREKTDGAAGAYGIAFYRNENDTLRLFQAFYGTDARFDRAWARWENDTTVTVRLYNSKNKEEKTIKAFRRGAATGLEID